LRPGDRSPVPTFATRSTDFSAGAFDRDRATDADALNAASLHPAGAQHGLSLAARACVALARRLGSSVATADHARSKLDVGVEITMIRAR
jgi:PIN domain nuclease of toxin-antitoxin system